MRTFAVEPVEGMGVERMGVEGRGVERMGVEGMGHIRGRTHGGNGCGKDVFVLRGRWGFPVEGMGAFLPGSCSAYLALY